MPNPIAQNPLLGKGGAHRKTRKARRRAHREALRDLVDQWQGETDQPSSDYHGTASNLERFDED